MKLIKIIFYSFFALSFSFMELKCNEGYISDILCFEYIIPIEQIQSTNSFSGEVSYSNPTLAYPLYFGYERISQINFTNIHYGGANFNFTFDSLYNEECQCVKFNFCFELLAGSDSIGTIILQNVKINETLLSDSSYSIKIKSTSNSLPYFKPSVINNVYPNPLFIDQNLNIRIFIDDIGETKFYLFNPAGKEKLLLENTNINKGIVEVTIPYDIKISTGFYWILMESFTGKDAKPLVIIK